MATEHQKVVYAIVAELDRQEVFNRPLSGALQVDGLINAYELADAILRASDDDALTTPAGTAQQIDPSRGPVGTAYHMGRDGERRVIASWLRCQTINLRVGPFGIKQLDLDTFADAIERGDHYSRDSDRNPEGGDEGHTSAPGEA